MTAEKLKSLKTARTNYLRAMGLPISSVTQFDSQIDTLQNELLSKPAHGWAPDQGRNVHCICGAEFSYATNLNRHIDTKNGK